MSTTKIQTQANSISMFGYSKIQNQGIVFDTNREKNLRILDFLCSPLVEREEGVRGAGGEGDGSSEKGKD